MTTGTKKALVLGLGPSGFAMAKFLAGREWDVTAADTRENPPKLADCQKEKNPIAFIGGAFPASLPEGCSLLALSPGLSPYFSAAAPLVSEARKKKIPVVGEIELFARELKRLRSFRGYRPKIIGITGTNGKTTTTILSSKMVAASGKSVCCAGNVGPNALSCLDDLLKKNELPDYWVLELSSFQLDTTSSLECTSAALLNLTEDHIDWHGSIEKYLEAKGRIFRGAKNRILNRADPASIAFAEGEGAFEVFTFGLDEPKALNDFGLVEKGPNCWLSAILNLEGAKGRRKSVSESELPRELVKLLPLNELKIYGPHNIMNALAASALCFSAGVDLKGIVEALDTYRGESHRVQKIFEAEGISFIDDSKGTNVGATAAALAGFGKKNVVIILGGDGKGQDFAPLKDVLETHAKYAVLIGQDAPKFEALLKETTVKYDKAVNMEEAVVKCIKQAKKGDVVLLSPACASWDMFKDYADRSAQFIVAAKKFMKQQ